LEGCDAAAYSPAVNLSRSRRLEVRGPRVGLGYGVAVAGTVVAAAALFPFRGRLGATDVVLIFLVVVVAAAASGGLGPGVVASLIGFVASDLLFVTPYYTLLVNKEQELLSLAVYLLVALVVSALVGTSEQRRVRAEQRERETHTLYELSASLVALGSLEATLDGAARTLRRLLGLAGCAIVLLDEDGGAHLAAKDGVVPDEVERRVASGGDEAHGELHVVPLRAANREVGALAVVAGGAAGGGGDLDLAQQRMLASFAGQAALAVEQARSEEARTKARALEATDRLRRALLNSVSHDLRTPLASILASASSLLDASVPLDEQEREQFLTTIEQEANRLARLVGNLLDMSRIEAGAVDPHLAEVWLPDVVNPAIQRARRTPSEQIIAVDVPESLPPVLVDPVRLEQVLTNLLDNARRYAGTGLVRVKGRPVDGNVELRVVDHGPGVPEDQQEQIFSQFYRLDSAGRRGGGTGLGLAICRGLVEAMGGRIWVETAPGGGAAFVICLRRADAAAGTGAS
jgi:two-component system, OmpR family, sensor histidine kinase KdpD